MPEQMFDKEAEYAVVACCIYSQTARATARDHLGRQDFFSVVAETIWTVMEELDATGTVVDPVSVNSALAGASRGVREELPSIITMTAIPDHVSTYAETVRQWAVRRRLQDFALGLRQRALNVGHDPYLLTSEAVTRLTELRDTGITADVQSRLLADLLAEADEPYDWVIPSLMEARDRLVITGQEGLGKSYLARQVAIFAAAGMHPFTLDPIEPVRVQIIDYENSWKQIKRGSRNLYDFAAVHGRNDLRARIHVASLKRIDITRDKDLSMLHREIDVASPDIIVVGPLYRLTNRAIQTDDEAAPVLSALDTLRDRGCSLIIEAHAGHARESGENGRPGERDLRPRGSSAFLGWPEFGYGMRQTGDGKVRMVPWRGDRDERGWPQFLRRARDPHSSHYLPDPEQEVYS